MVWIPKPVNFRLGGGGPNDYQEVRDALRDLRKTWRSFSKEVKANRISDRYLAQ